MAQPSKEAPWPDAAAFTEEQFAVCCDVIKALGGDMELFMNKRFKPLRKLLMPIVEHQQQRMFGGMSKDKYHSQQHAKKRRKLEAFQRKQLDQQHINASELRRKRLERLEALANQDTDMDLANMLIPDGVAADAAPAAAAPLLLTSSTEASSESKEEGAQPRKVFKHRSCYTCATRFQELHKFYDRLCPPCADLNYKKRLQLADLRGRVVIVTGARVKIGYQCGLKVLRSGGTLIATSRFPIDCASRYAKEADFEQWKDRLHVYGVDLRDIQGVQHFAAEVQRRFVRLDAIINNACQTVRRPPAYYSHLLPQERQGVAALPSSAAHVVEGHFELLDQRAIASSSGKLLADASGAKAGDGTRVGGGQGEGEEEEGDVRGVDEPDTVGAAVAMQTALPHGEAAARSGTSRGHAKRLEPQEVKGVLPSTEASQVALLPSDHTDEAALPQGILDVNGQQVDLRRMNSWLLKIDQVTVPELVEVFAINAISPFVLNSHLIPFMEKSQSLPLDVASTGVRGEPAGPAKAAEALPYPLIPPSALSTVSSARFIVNVSAMEGKFYRYKSPCHPHTNMAKAALNMMTRTSAPDLQKKDIYMTAVDTGWINDENPLEKASKIFKTNNFQTPLDEVDAAARVLDPMFAPLIALAEGKAFDPPVGQFLKDYKATEW